MILALGFAVFVLYGFPGFMSTDSFTQLVEARTRSFSPSHPPIMSVIWMVLDAIVAGPILMLLLQGALFLFGANRLFARALSPMAAACAAVGTLWFPPVLSVMAVVWKDSLMAACLLTGTALLLEDRKRLGLFVLTIACGVRWNALAAVVPVVGLVFVANPQWKWLKRYAASAAMSVVIVGVAFGTNRLLVTKQPEMSPASGTAVSDVIGVLFFTADRTDAELEHLLAGTGLRVHENIHAYVRDHYSARNSYWGTHGAERLFDLPPPNSPQEVALLRAWKTIVASDWKAYARHRVLGFRHLIGLVNAELWAPVWGNFLEDPAHGPTLQHDAMPSRFQLVTHDLFSTLALDTPLFRPFIWIIVALLILVAFARDRMTVTLLASGLCYELSFLPAAGTPDYRYSHWLITATVLSVVALIARRARR